MPGTPGRKEAKQAGGGAGRSACPTASLLGRQAVRRHACHRPHPGPRAPWGWPVPAPSGRYHTPQLSLGLWMLLHAWSPNQAARSPTWPRPGDLSFCTARRVAHCAREMAVRILAVFLEASQ